MPREEKLAGLRTIIAGGPDRQGGGDGPVVCLLHGFGASGDDLAGLWRVLDVPREVRFAFPEAPISLMQFFGVPAFAWWLIDVGRFNAVAADRSGKLIAQLMDEEPDGLAEAREQVLRWLGELRRLLGTEGRPVPLYRIVLGGFSQGAMLATDVALHVQQRGGSDGSAGTGETGGGAVASGDPAKGGGADDGLAGLVVLSGALLNQPRWARLLAGAKPTPRFQSHGTVDQILPFVIGEALHEFLQAGPFPGDFHRFRGGHEIPPGVLSALGRTLTGWLAGESKD